MTSETSIDTALFFEISCDKIKVKIKKDLDVVLAARIYDYDKE
jgi:hypothetical protein